MIRDSPGESSICILTLFYTRNAHIISYLCSRISWEGEYAGGVNKGTLSADLQNDTGVDEHCEVGKKDVEDGLSERD